MNLIIDTSILVDYLRRYKLAENFVDNLSERELNISIISEMEIIRGCQTKASLKLAKKFLRHFRVFLLTAQISQEAKIILEKYRFVSFIDIPDSLIAATAFNKKCRLLTTNLKDFQIIKGLSVERPY